MDLTPDEEHHCRCNVPLAPAPRAAWANRRTAAAPTRARVAISVCMWKGYPAQ